MGKRRGKSVPLALRIARLRKLRDRQRIRPPWLCPICNKQTVWFDRRKNLIFVFCSEERLGEVFPYTRPFRPIDYYCWFFDKRVSDEFGIEFNEPIFRFRNITERQLQNLSKRITVGILQVVR